MGPGAIALTRMPCAPHSKATVRVRLRIAVLVAAYIANPLVSGFNITEDTMLMIDAPAPR